MCTLITCLLSANDLFTFYSIFMNQIDKFAAIKFKIHFQKIKIYKMVELSKILNLINSENWEELTREFDQLLGE